MPTTTDHADHTFTAPPAPDDVPFGPVLVGQLEKTLQSLLRESLQGTGLTESTWVTLRLATMLDGQVDRDELVAAVADRAKFADASTLVDALTERGLLADGRPTHDGRALVDDVVATNYRRNGAIWQDLPAADVEATTRTLNEVLRRARRLSVAGAQDG